MQKKPRKATKTVKVVHTSTLPWMAGVTGTFLLFLLFSSFLRRFSLLMLPRKTGITGTFLLLLFSNLLRRSFFQLQFIR